VCLNGGIIRFTDSGQDQPRGSQIIIEPDEPPFDKSDALEKDSDTYKILADLERRWNDAGKLPGAERRELRERCERVAADAKRLDKEDTPYMYGQEAVADTLHENAKIAVEFQSKSLNTASFTEGRGYSKNSVAYLALMAQTDWDYKQNTTFQVGGNDLREKYASFNGLDMDKEGENRRNWTPWIYFEGKVIAADDVGNMNMAYAGKKMGLSPSVYNNIVTRNQFPEIWKPDERDIAAIEWGIELADSGW
jgi:hypothetical protein